MKTLTLEVEESFVPNLLEYLKQFKNEVHIQQDKNLELDPYFYERQKELQQIRDDIKNGKTKMIDNETFWNDIEKHIETL
ncbi:MAG: hypothetical protein WCY75_12260 [Sulfurimonadaceae bacterium]|jgi:hypothetical protein